MYLLYSNYIIKKWGASGVVKEIAIISKEDTHLPGKSRSLVNSDKKCFDFDEITKQLYSTDNLPASADAIQIKGYDIRFIEFKKILRESDNLTMTGAKKILKDEKNVEIKFGFINLNFLMIV